VGTGLGIGGEGGGKLASVVDWRGRWTSGRNRGELGRASRRSPAPMSHASVESKPSQWVRKASVGPRRLASAILKSMIESK
jgi:hypothetical protein